MKQTQKSVKPNLYVSPRIFNTIILKNNVFRKESLDTKKLQKEIKWYLKLPNQLCKYKPEIFNYGLDDSNTFIEMKFYKYDTLHYLLLNNKLDKNGWIKVFKLLKSCCEEFQKFTIKNNTKKDLENMYLYKTTTRLEKLRNNNNFSKIFSVPITINGITYLSLDDIIRLLKIYIPKVLYNVNEFTIIHGDMCFSNILINNDYTNIILVDPRGSFGDQDIYGDQRYEYAKILHSIDGKYDFIIKDKFILSYNSNLNEFSYSVETQDTTNLVKIFFEIFDDLVTSQTKEIYFIESLLFLSMIPLHSESISQQYAMLITGIQILDKILDIRKKN